MAGPLRPFDGAGVEIERPNQVWATDGTFTPRAAGIAYLVAILDVHCHRIPSGLVEHGGRPLCIDVLREGLVRYALP